MSSPVVAAPRRRRSDDGLAGWLFALPHLLLFTVFLLIPVVYGFYISLHRWHVLSLTQPFIWLENYRAALADDIFWIAVRNTAYFVLLVVPFGNIVSLGLALGLSRVRRFNTFYKVAYYLPVIISISVVAVLWRWLYNTEIGLLNTTLRSIFPDMKPVPWLANPSYVMPSIALLSIWWGAGGNMIVYLAGLGNIPDDYYEAARIDGANSWQQFRHVTLPLLRPTILFCLVFSVLGAFQIFGQSYVLFSEGGRAAFGPNRSGLTLALYMYLQGFNQYQLGYGTAVAYLLFLFVLAFTIAQFRLFEAERKTGT